MAETSGQPPAARGAAWRRRQRRLRSMLRHERQTVAMELAALHQSCGGWARDERRLRADDGRPAGGERAAALLEARPQERDRRHTGVGFELVLDPVVPQLGHELVEVPIVVSQPEFEQHSAEQNVDIPVRGDRPARVLSDLAHLDRFRGRTAMEVMRWFVDPARGFTLTSEEQYSMVRSRLQEEDHRQPRAVYKYWAAW